MNRVLDIDMDFFLNETAYFNNGHERLSDEDFIPWNEERFRRFLEQNCGLSQKNKIPGRIIVKHDEAFDYCKELIGKKELKISFEITHIDAHSDLGLGDSSWYHLVSDLMHYSIEERSNYLKREKVMMSNYLAYIIACGWVNKVNLVYPKRWNFDDFVKILLENDDDNSKNFELKAYDKKIKAESFHNISFDESPLYRDPLLPFEIFTDENFSSNYNFDRLIFCQSPDYTPASADYMMEVIKDYIIEE